MGVHTQPLTTAPLMRALGRRGIAMMSALLALVALSVLVVGLFTMADLQAKAMRNREEAARASQLAEAGAAHAIGVLRTHFPGTWPTDLLLGDDGSAGTADDGLLIGYGLASTDEIPAAGVSFDGGTYYVELVDDPADPDGDPEVDSNYRLRLDCRAVTAAGAEAEVNLIVRSLVLPGIAVDGDLEISGKPNITGPCGGVHTNGDLSGGGEPTASTQWSSTDGSIPSKFNGRKITGAPSMDIPDLNPMEYCPTGATIVNGNFTLRSSTAPGVYCVDGNVTSSGDFGSMSNMKSITIIATGSITFSSKPHIKAAHPDGILLMAGGDFKFDGDWGGQGLAYTRGKCEVSGKMHLLGQFICADQPGASGPADKNLISGDARIEFDCNSLVSDTFSTLAWYPTFGT